MSQIVEVFPVEPWARQPNETESDYEIFKFFRDTQPMERVAILAEICRKFGMEDWEVKDLARKKHWIVRARKYDIWLDGSQRQGSIMKRTQLGIEMVSLSERLMKLSETALEKLIEDKKQPSYREVVEMLRASIQLNQAGFGLQGLAVGKEKEDDKTGESGSPAEYVKAAVQVNVLIQNQTKGIEVDPEDIIENDPDEEL